jgi:hypothetical protein
VGEEVGTRLVIGAGEVYGTDSERGEVEVLNGHPGQMDFVVVTAMMEVLHGAVVSEKTGGVVVVSSQGVVVGGVHVGHVFVVLLSQSDVGKGHQFGVARTGERVDRRRMVRGAEVCIFSDKEEVIRSLMEALEGKERPQ